MPIDVGAAVAARLLESSIEGVAPLPKHSGRYVICICGSTRFRDQMQEANRDLTLTGMIVIAPGVFQHQGDPVTPEDKKLLDALHTDKIDMSDHVVVVAPGGYIGESTRREIHYAEQKGKSITYWPRLPAAR